jgi:hypothetical protein
MHPWDAPWPQTVEMRLTVRRPALTALILALALGGCAITAPTGLPAPASTGSTPAVTPGGDSMDFPTIRLSGHGDAEAAFTSPDATPAIAVVASTGVGPFSIESLAVDHTVIDVLVSATSPYAGTVLFDWQAGNKAVAFRVAAGDDWTIEIEPVDHAPSWAAASSLTGSGDGVVRLAEPIAGSLGVRVVHPDNGRLAVTAHIGDEDEGPGSYADLARDPLLSVTGRYDGVIELPDGTVLVTIGADGKWTMSPA